MYYCISIVFVCLIDSGLLEIVSPRAGAGPASALLVTSLRAGALRSAVPQIASFACAGYAMSYFSILRPTCTVRVVFGMAGATRRDGRSASLVGHEWVRKWVHWGCYILSRYVRRICCTRSGGGNVSANAVTVAAWPCVVLRYVFCSYM
jgi:hypothetical protein